MNRRVFAGLELERVQEERTAVHDFFSPLPLCPLLRYSERSRLFEEGRFITSYADSTNDMIYLVFAVWALHTLFARQISALVNTFNPRLWDVEIVPLLPEKRAALSEVVHDDKLYKLPLLVHTLCVCLALLSCFSKWFRQTSRTQLAADLDLYAVNLLLLLLSLTNLFSAVGLKVAERPMSSDLFLLGAAFGTVQSYIVFRGQTTSPLSFLAATPVTELVPLAVKCLLFLHTFLTVLNERNKTGKKGGRVRVNLRIAKVCVVALFPLVATHFVKAEVAKGCSDAGLQPWWYKFLEMAFFWVVHDVMVGRDFKTKPTNEKKSS